MAALPIILGNANSKNEVLDLGPAAGLIEKAPNVGQRLNALARIVLDTPELRDAYVSLLGGVRLSRAFGRGKSVLVTSTQPNEGKTTIAYGLAITASLTGHKALLVDG